MTKLKVAILEDNKVLLKDIKQNLEDTGLVEPVSWSASPDEFLENVKTSKPEALILDIDLSGESINGLDIANKLKLPVLFVSGKTKDFYPGIEDLNMNSEISVEHISKPITLEKLNKILPKFINEIRALNKMQFVYLDFSDSKKNKISIDTIVYLCTNKEKGADSNNKEIFFTNRKPELLIDFSFSKMEEKGLSKSQFIVIHKSFRVNVEKIIRYLKETHKVEVEICNLNGKMEIILLHVADNYRYATKHIIQ